MSLSEMEKMRLGFSHLPDDAELSTIRLKVKDLLYEYNIFTPPSDKLARASLLSKILGKSGKDPHINAPFYCDYGQFIQVGERFFANYNCVILDSGGVFIGNDVLFGPNVSLYTVNHPLDPELRNSGVEYGKPIHIGNSVWVGGNTVILGGVSIGDNVVIGAGSVVTKNIPSNSLAVGNPARVLREICAKDRENYIKNLISR